MVLHSNSFVKSVHWKRFKFGIEVFPFFSSFGWFDSFMMNTSRYFLTNVIPIPSHHEFWLTSVMPLLESMHSSWEVIDGF